MARIGGKLLEPGQAQTGSQIPLKAVAKDIDRIVLTHRAEDWEWCARTNRFEPRLLEHRVTPGANGVTGLRGSDSIQEITAHLTSRRLQVFSLATPGLLAKVGSFCHTFETTGRTKEDKVVEAILPIWRELEAVGDSYEQVFLPEKYDAYRHKLIDAGFIAPMDPALAKRLKRKHEKRLERLITRGEQSGLSKYTGRVARAEKLIEDMSKHMEPAKTEAPKAEAKTNG